MIFCSSVIPAISFNASSFVMAPFLLRFCVIIIKDWSGEFLSMLKCLSFTEINCDNLRHMNTNEKKEVLCMKKMVAMVVLICCLFCSGYADTFWLPFYIKDYDATAQVLMAPRIENSDYEGFEYELSDEQIVYHVADGVWVAREGLPAEAGMFWEMGRRLFCLSLHLAYPLDHILIQLIKKQSE